MHPLLMTALKGSVNGVRFCQTAPQPPHPLSLCHVTLVLLHESETKGLELSYSF